jgi:hypothetical protein
MSTTSKDDRSLEVKVVAAVFVAIASVTVILRCYVRLFVVKAFGWDDGAMVIAMVFYPPFQFDSLQILTYIAMVPHVLRMYDRGSPLRHGQEIR